MFLTSLTKFRDWGLLLLRVALGAYYIYAHGWHKLAQPHAVREWHDLGMAMKYIGVHFGYVFWGLMAALSETLGCVMVILGLFFRVACILLCITLAVAVAMHLQSGKGNPSEAIELGILFFSLLFIGPGKYSIDKN